MLDNPVPAESVQPRFQKNVSGNSQFDHSAATHSDVNGSSGTSLSYAFQAPSTYAHHTLSDDANNYALAAAVNHDMHGLDSSLSMSL